MYTIRQSIPSDLNTILKFQQAMAFETEGMHLAEETLRKGIQRLFDEPAKGAYWVAEHEGKVIACVLILTEWSDWRNGDVLWIHSLYVEQPFRKQGIFKQFYSHFKNMVETSDHLKGLRLYVEKRNENAQRAYESVGMTKEHYELYEWLK
jgi:GNAT superfamily N-acetyltransferase